MPTTDQTLQAGQALTDEAIGVFSGIRTGSSPPDEPRVHTAAVNRAHPTSLTDGVTVPPSEGGCALDPDAALASAIGEGVERYCAAIYRNSDLRESTYGALNSAIDPSSVVNFAPAQRDAGTVPSPLYRDGDEIRWVEGERLSDGTAVYVPAQLVYLSYDMRDVPFIRAPISTGLAAGLDREAAVRRGLLEIVERDAFMIHYLTRSPLPTLRVENRDGPVGRLLDRIGRAGLTWHLLDARTDIGIPVVIAVLVDPHGTPAVTVAASARPDARAAVQAALEEAIQTRLYQQHLGATSAPEGAPEGADIDRESRLRAWSEPGSAADLDFWTETDATMTLAELDAETAALDADGVRATVGQKWDVSVVDVTTRDVAETGFEVVRVVAPAAHPLYLRETRRYWEMSRLATVPVACGYREEPPTQSDLTGQPHPFP
ncbi:YcaO-like family protein [Haloarcula salinisoli]|uniref:YcaO-like family protein n=1 Tax=Haloarcula salinisoli TaxID=2487746 RepID=A0A8J7YG18_9EURY|nr:YcaO-like family protein [Halomicroarcula salinisoli]MBX0302703.1 YcaO-like family protein [Halomicroarcula salinisoli]